MDVKVRCSPEGDFFLCAVTVSDAAGSTNHAVRVSQKDMHRWSRGRSAEQLVKDSFRFLLQRESKQSILLEFDLAVIQRYFPEYDG